MIDEKQVVDFKTKWSNENQIIKDLIKNELMQYFVEPILDAGCGTGDIVYESLATKKVYCVDIIDFSKYPLALKQVRETTDFFDYEIKEKIGTIFFSHSLQFLDDRLEELYKRIEEINAECIVTITNTNNDIIGELIDYLNKEKIIHNAEVHLDGFPRGYRLITRKIFSSSLVYLSFDILFEQIKYLFDLQLTNDAESEKLRHFLVTKIREPKITIHQQIKIYKHEK